MEKELNIAAILKEKPNIIIYDLLHNIYVKLDYISTTDRETVIWCTKAYPNKTSYFGYSELGTERGWLDGLQILKPSKQMRDWSKFAWKKGDVLSCGVDNLCIFKSWANSNYTEFNAMYVPHTYANYTCTTEMWTKETNEGTIKQYISKIEKIKGGKLNLETLEIEKQPEFKDGDIFTLEEDDTYIKTIGIFKGYNEEERIMVYAAYNVCRDMDYINVATYDRPIRLATDSEKQQLFDALAKEGKHWNPDTLQIEDLPKKCEFKPFDKVLVRMKTKDTWQIELFSHLSKDEDTSPYHCIYGY